MGLLDFNGAYKTLFAVQFKHSSFWHLVNVKPMWNGLCFM